MAYRSLKSAQTDCTRHWLILYASIKQSRFLVFPYFARSTHSVECNIGMLYNVLGVASWRWPSLGTGYTSSHAIHFILVALLGYCSLPSSEFSGKNLISPQNASKSGALGVFSLELLIAMIIYPFRLMLVNNVGGQQIVVNIL